MKMFKNLRSSSLRRASQGLLHQPAQRRASQDTTLPIKLYVNHIGGKWNEGYYDGIHTLPSAFRFSQNPKEDTVDELTVPFEVAKKLLDDDNFADGYHREMFCRKYVTRKDVY